MAIRRPGHAESQRKWKRREQDHARGSAASRGYGRRHRAVAEATLRRDKFCAECARHGITRDAEILDHIVPFKGNDQLQWDEQNHQVLCKECHDRKSANESGGWRKAGR